MDQECRQNIVNDSGSYW